MSDERITGECFWDAHDEGGGVQCCCECHRNANVHPIFRELLNQFAMGAEPRRAVLVVDVDTQANLPATKVGHEVRSPNSTSAEMPTAPKPEQIQREQRDAKRLADLERQAGCED